MVKCCNINLQPSIWSQPKYIVCHTLTFWIKLETLLIKCPICKDKLIIFFCVIMVHAEVEGWTITIIKFYYRKYSFFTELFMMKVTNYEKLKSHYLDLPSSQCFKQIIIKSNSFFFCSHLLRLFHLHNKYFLISV